MYIQKHSSYFKSKHPVEDVCWLTSDHEFQVESLSATADFAGGWCGPPISTEVKLLSDPDVAKQGGIEPPDTTITFPCNLK